MKPILALLLVTAAAAHADENPYVYQRMPVVAPVRLELETGIGTRDSRPFGEEGVEQAVRASWLPIPRLELSLRGGILLDNPDRKSVAVEAMGEVLPWLRIGGGYVHDYRNTSVLRARVIGHTEVGGVTLAASALLEMPIDAVDRDGVDIILGVAASVRLHQRVRAGVELLGEDLEGLWEADEAEGGARLLVGPAIWLGLTDHVDLTLSPGLSIDGAGVGFLGRAAVGFGF